jgi:hypothetical protein
MQTTGNKSFGSTRRSRIFATAVEAVQDLGMYWLLLNQPPRIEK